MGRLKLINLSTFFSLVLGLALVVEGLSSHSRSTALSGGVLAILSGIIALIGNELLKIKKTLDRIDRR